MMSIAMSYRKLITSISLIIFMINLESSDDSKYNDGFLRIQTQLNLTDEQTDQFKPIFLDYLKKRMDTMNKHGINRESRSNAQNIDIRQLRKFKKDMDKINKAVIDDLEEFMNKDQIAKFKEMLEVQRNEMREKLLQRYQDRNS